MFIKIITGLACGLLNGLFGSGGGIAAVPLLECSGLEPRKSHATSVALIFFLSLVSAAVYAYRGNLDYTAALAYIPSGIIGAVTGAFLLKKAPNLLLRRIFGAVMLVSAVRILIK